MAFLLTFTETTKFTDCVTRQVDAELVAYFYLQVDSGCAVYWYIVPVGDRGDVLRPDVRTKVLFFCVETLRGVYVYWPFLTYRGYLTFF